MIRFGALDIPNPELTHHTVTRCAHPFCRTSLTEDTAVECPHGLPFCEHCTWEDGCDECVLEPMRQRAAAAWDAATTPPPMLTPAEIAAAEWAERRAEDDAYELAHLEDREEMRAS